MITSLLALTCALAIPLSQAPADEPSVRIEPPSLQGSRPLEKRTEQSVIRDYLESWKVMDSALSQNQASLLGADFVGTARDKLANTIDEQLKAGIHTHYQERSHDLQIVFYSPEGLSIQMTDTVEYDEQVMDHDKLLTSRPVRRRYLVVLSPSEVRWRVRILQSEPATD